MEIFNSKKVLNTRSYRLENIDMLRGLVMLIMAIDHVRDLFMIAGVQDPMAQPDISTGLYLTRWITHFCAPVFVFLAGTSVGLMAKRKTKGELAKFLTKRGIWLIIVEIVIISTALSFSQINGIEQLEGRILITLQVIWAIGASMIVLAGCQYFGAKYCLIIGIIIVFGHDLLGSFWPSGDLFSGLNPFWYGMLTQSSTIHGSFLFITGYPLLPWIGVMLLGYGLAFIFEKEPSERDKTLFWGGVSMFTLFFIIRLTGFYGDPNPWHIHEDSIKATIFDFMNLSKYPPSLLFLLATLGPMAILCSYADKINGRIKDLLVMFGRVPFAFYVVHWYLIRLMSFALANYQGFELKEMMTFFFFLPEGYGVSLTGVYIVWVLVIVIMYPFCFWVAKVKSVRKDWWLSYV